MSDPKIMIEVGTYLDKRDKTVENYIKDLENMQKKADEIDLSGNISKAIQGAMDDLKKLNKEYEKTVQDLANNKLDTKAFEKFAQEVDSKMDEITGRIGEAEQSLLDLQKTSNDLDLGKLQNQFNSIKTSFKEFKQDTKTAMKMLKDFQKLTDQSYGGKQLKDLTQTLRGLSRIDLSNLNTVEVKKSLGAVHQELGKTYDEFLKFQKVLNDDKSSPKMIKNAEDQLAKIIPKLEQSIRELASKKKLSIDDIFSTKSNYEFSNAAGKVFNLDKIAEDLELGLGDIKKRLIARKEDLQKEIDALASTNADTFTFKNGGIQIPVVIDEKSKAKVEASLNEFIDKISKQTENNPIDVTLRLFPLKTSKKEVKEVNDHIKDIRAQIPKLDNKELSDGLNDLVNDLEKEYQKALILKIKVEFSEDLEEIQRRIKLIETEAKKANITINPKFEITQKEAEKLNKKLEKISKDFSIDFDKRITTMSDSLNRLFSENKVIDWGNAFEQTLQKIDTQLRNMKGLLEPLIDLYKTTEHVKEGPGRPSKEFLESKTSIDKFTETMDLLNKALAEREKVPKLNAEDFTRDIQKEIDAANIPVQVPVEPNVEGFVEQLEAKLKTIPVDVAINGITGGTVGGSGGGNIIIAPQNGTIEVEQATVTNESSSTPETKGANKTTTKVSGYKGVSKQWINKEFQNVYFGKKGKVTIPAEERKATAEFNGIYDAYMGFLRDISDKNNEISKLEKSRDRALRNISEGKGTDDDKALVKSFDEQYKKLDNELKDLNQLSKKHLELNPILSDIKGRSVSAGQKDEMLEKYLEGRGIKRTAPISAWTYLDKLKEEVSGKGDFNRRTSGDRAAFKDIVRKYIGFEYKEQQAKKEDPNYKSRGWQIENLTDNVKAQKKLREEYNKMSGVINETSKAKENAIGVSDKVARKSDYEGVSTEKLKERYAELAEEKEKWEKSDFSSADLITSNPEDVNELKSIAETLDKIIDARKEANKLTKLGLVEAPDESEENLKKLGYKINEYGYAVDAKSRNEFADNLIQKLMANYNLDENFFKGIKKKQIDELSKQALTSGRKNDVLGSLEVELSKISTELRLREEEAKAAVQATEKIQEVSEQAIEVAEEAEEVVEEVKQNIEQQKKNLEETKKEVKQEEKKKESKKKSTKKKKEDEEKIKPDFLKEAREKKNKKKQNIEQQTQNTKDFVALKQFIASADLRKNTNAGKQNLQEFAKRFTEYKKNKGKFNVTDLSDDPKVQAKLQEAVDAYTASLKENQQAKEENSSTPTVNIEDAKEVEKATDEVKKNTEAQKENKGIREQVRDAIFAHKYHGDIDLEGIPGDQQKILFDNTMASVEKDKLTVKQAVEKFKQNVEVYRELQNKLAESVDKQEEKGVAKVQELESSNEETLANLSKRISGYDKEKLQLQELKTLYLEYESILDKMPKYQSNPVFSTREDAKAQVDMQKFFAEQLSKRGYKYDADKDDFVKGNRKFGLEAEEAQGIAQAVVMIEKQNKALDENTQKQKENKKAKQENANVSSVLDTLKKKDEEGFKNDLVQDVGLNISQLIKAKPSQNEEDARELSSILVALIKRVKKNIQKELNDNSDFESANALQSSLTGVFENIDNLIDDKTSETGEKAARYGQIIIEKLTENGFDLTKYIGKAKNNRIDKSTLDSFPERINSLFQDNNSYEKVRDEIKQKKSQLFNLYAEQFNELYTEAEQVITSDDGSEEAKQRILNIYKKILDTATNTDFAKPIIDSISKISFNGGTVEQRKFIEFLKKEAPVSFNQHVNSVNGKDSGIEVYRDKYNDVINDGIDKIDNLTLQILKDHIESILRTLSRNDIDVPKDIIKRIHDYNISEGRKIEEENNLLSKGTTPPSAIDEITQAEDKMGNEAQEATDQARQGLAEMREESNAVSTEVERQNEKLGKQKSLYDQIFERVEKIRILGAVGKSKEDLIAYGEGKYGFESPDTETYRMQMNSLKTLTPSGKSNADIRDLVFDPSKTIEEVTKELVRAAEDYQTCKQSLDEMFSKAGIVGGKLYDDAYRMLDNASLSSEDMANVVSDTKAKLGMLQQENTIREESRKKKEAEAQAQAELNKQKSAEPTSNKTPVLDEFEIFEEQSKRRDKIKQGLQSGKLIQDIPEARDIDNLKTTLHEYELELERCNEAINDPKMSSSSKNYYELQKNAIQGYINDIRSFLDVIPDDPFKDLFDSTEGEEQGKKYVEGVESLKSDAEQAGANLANAANEGTADAQKSKSPSKVAEKLGKYWGEGYADGILNSQAKVKNAVRALVETAKLTLDDLRKDNIKGTDTANISKIVLDEIYSGKNPTKMSQGFIGHIQDVDKTSKQKATAKGQLNKIINKLNKSDTLPSGFIDDTDFNFEVWIEKAEELGMEIEEFRKRYREARSKFIFDEELEKEKTPKAKKEPKYTVNEEKEPNITDPKEKKKVTSGLLKDQKAYYTELLGYEKKLAEAQLKQDDELVEHYRKQREEAQTLYDDTTKRLSALADEKTLQQQELELGKLRRKNEAEIADIIAKRVNAEKKKNEEDAQKQYLKEAEERNKQREAIDKEVAKHVAEVEKNNLVLNADTVNKYTGVEKPEGYYDYKQLTEDGKWLGALQGPAEELLSTYNQLYEAEKKLDQAAKDFDKNPVLAYAKAFKDAKNEISAIHSKMKNLAQEVSIDALSSKQYEQWEKTDKALDELYLKREAREEVFAQKQAENAQKQADAVEKASQKELEALIAKYDRMDVEEQKRQAKEQEKRSKKYGGLQGKLESAIYDLGFEKENGNPTAEFAQQLENKIIDIKTLIEKVNNEGIDVVTEDEIMQAEKLLEEVRQIRKEGKLTENRKANENSIQKNLAQINGMLSDNTKLSFKRTDVYKDLVSLQERFKNFDTSRPQSELAELTTELLKTKARFEDLDNTVKGKNLFQTFIERIHGTTAQLVAQYLSWMDIIRYIRTMATTIIDLDTQLVDLRKTTTMTTSELNEFYNASSDIAKTLGVTTSEIISQSAAWSRLGYSSKEAATEMAQLSSKFASISPGMTTENSTDYLVSTMQANIYA